ncbi:MAG: hypothetical protein OEV93_05335, partial [Candidatus Moranbacteria bacterium]|nr:hypothetical protein [Candidatus Moranbacteria bacterium]
LYDLSIEWLSPKLTSMSGCSETELVGCKRRITHLFGFEEKEATETVWKDAKEEGVREFVAKMKDGQKYQIKMHFFTFKFEETFYRVGKMEEVQKLPQ